MGGQRGARPAHAPAQDEARELNRGQFRGITRAVFRGPPLVRCLRGGGAGLQRLAQRERFDCVAGVLGCVFDLAFAPGAGEVRGGAAGAGLEVLRARWEIVGLLAGVTKLSRIRLTITIGSGIRRYPIGEAGARSVGMPLLRLGYGRNEEAHDQAAQPQAAGAG